MKKIIMIFCAIVMGIYSAHAYTICAKNNTYVGVLRKSVNGTVSAVNSTRKQWQVAYDYKTITGIAACNEISGTYGTPLTNLYTNSGDAGQYCWCQMWPVNEYDNETGMTSYWVFLKEYTGSNAVSDCASGCTQSCADAMATNSVFRSAVFESVW